MTQIIPPRFCTVWLFARDVHMYYFRLVRFCFFVFRFVVKLHMNVCSVLITIMQVDSVLHQVKQWLITAYVFYEEITDKRRWGLFLLNIFCWNRKGKNLTYSYIYIIKSLNHCNWYTYFYGVIFIYCFIST